MNDNPYPDRSLLQEKGNQTQITSSIRKKKKKKVGAQVQKPQNKCNFNDDARWQLTTLMSP